MRTHRGAHNPFTKGISKTNGITMTNAVIECILSRSAAKYYEPAATLSDDQIRELVRIGTTAPTSFKNSPLQLSSTT